MFPAPLAVAPEFELPLDGFLILPRRVVCPLARAAAESNQLFGEFALCHNR